MRLGANNFSHNMTAVSLLVLQAVWLGSLHIQHFKNMDDVFICFDTNGIRNETWPTKWSRMDTFSLNGTRTLRHMIPANSTLFKLKLSRRGKATQDTNWMKIKMGASVKPTDYSSTLKIIEGFSFYISIVVTFIGFLIYYKLWI